MGLRLDSRVSSKGCCVRETTARKHLPGPNALGRGRTHPRSGSAGTPVPRAHCAGVRRAAAVPDGGRGTGSYDTYLTTPPSPQAAPTKLATPGTIFRRRLVLGGGYQPPIRHSQPTQPPASRYLPRPRTPGGREGSGRRRDAVRPLGSGSGTGGQRATACQSRGAGTTGEP